VKESCWHQCPHCRKDWRHSVNSTAPPDSYFTPCAACQVTQGFDAVAVLEKQRRTAKAATTEQVEEFSVLTPEREEEA
jgi:hypothetical protein